MNSMRLQLVLLACLATCVMGHFMMGNDNLSEEDIKRLVKLHANLGYAPELEGFKWQDQPASAKCGVIKDKATADKTPYGWYSSIHEAELFTESMDTSFDNEMDDMPAQSFGLEERPKLIHSVGAIGQCKWVSVGSHNYTGMFKGVDEAFIRFSLAKEPDGKGPIVPGISLKLLRTGVSSSNLFAMYSLLGQTSYNFFEHDLTNHAPHPFMNNASVSNQLLFKAFLKASNYPTMLGLAELSETDQNGINNPNPTFPYRLIFHPTHDYHKAFPSTPQEGNEFFIPQFEKLNINNPIYDVYAEAFPGDMKPLKIAEIQMVTQPSGSQWGDKNMFFQHSRMEDDFAYRPEWITPTKQIIADMQKAQTPPGYTFPDLPFN